MSYFTFSPRAVAASRAIVPYIRRTPRAIRKFGYTALGPARRYPRTTTAAGMLPFTKHDLQRTRAKIYKRAANRRRKKFNRLKIGERVGTGVAKASSTEQIAVTVNTKNLFELPLLNLTQSASEINTTNRLRQTVNFRGLKFCINTRAIANVLNTPLYVHIAVVSPKTDQTITTADFFRSAGENTSRSVSFSNSLSGIDFQCLNLNSDKFLIHKHKRFALGPRNIKSEDVLHTFYMPLKRQVRYDTASDVPIGKNMFLLMWCSTLEEIGGAIGGDGMAITYRIVKYFREPLGT